MGYHIEYPGRNIGKKPRKHRRWLLLIPVLVFAACAAIPSCRAVLLENVSTILENMAQSAREGGKLEDVIETFYAEVFHSYGQ